MPLFDSKGTQNYNCSLLLQGEAAMGIPIRIDEALYETAKVRAKAEMRSIPQQVAYWAKVGKAALDNPDLPVEFVRDTLLALEEESEPFDFPNP
ncbi:MAG: ParD-like family protein [Giesbergeria sp.]|uniref:ParD-like family protein n=1 Tax=Giesbergeria sp. TaxID=2818473 RepID=UPI0026173ECF|nr:ParD-like family protein [Giesbergeria sp.]MDD2608759.1 ParD-like family protein [Giesbergeria sp.]